MKRQDKLQLYFNQYHCAQELEKEGHTAFAHDLRKAAHSLYRAYRFTDEEISTGIAKEET